jgi:hypothetical protein
MMFAESDLSRYINAKLAREQISKVATATNWPPETGIRQEVSLGCNIQRVFSTVDGNSVNFRQSYAVFIEAALDGACGKAIRVFYPIQSFFFDCRKYLTIAQKDGGAIMHHEAGAIIFVVTLAATMHT